MTRPRVLVIDDSVVVRRFLGSVVESDPTLELCGSAATASIAFQKISQLTPDVVVLDIEMPEMDGLEAATRMRRDWPALPILMCSSLTARGASVTLKALAAGATDYVAKPSSMADGTGLTAFRTELLAKLHVLTRHAVAPAAPTRLAPPPPPPLPTRTRSAGRVEAILIGCSTGGPNALATVFAGLPGDLPVPIVIVQHMPPLFTRMLAERLTATSRVRVVEAAHGDLIVPGIAYLAPGGSHLTVVREGGSVRAALNQDPPENSCRPAVDVLFRSAATVWRDGVYAAVLTGMGQDGTRGARQLVDAGGTVVVQDAASCVVPTMPMSVAEAGLASEFVPIDRLAAHLVSRLQRTARPPAAHEAHP